MKFNRENSDMDEDQDSDDTMMVRPSGMLKLIRFGAWCARTLREEAGNIDGICAQDKMLDMGILELHKAQESCGERCACEEHGAFPRECYRFAEDVRDLIAPHGA
jgi:hypothetical protein